MHGSTLRNQLKSSTVTKLPPSQVMLWICCFHTPHVGAPVSTTLNLHLLWLQLTFPSIRSPSLFKNPVSWKTRGLRRVREGRGKFPIIYPSAMWGSDVEAGNELWTWILHARGPSGHKPTYWDQAGNAECGLMDLRLIGLLFVYGRNPHALLSESWQN